MEVYQALKPTLIVAKPCNYIVRPKHTLPHKLNIVKEASPKRWIEFFERNNPLEKTDCQNLSHLAQLDLESREPHC